MNTVHPVLPAVDGGAAEIVCADAIVTSPTRTLPALGHLSEPVQESLRLWVMLEDVGDLVKAFLSWFDEDKIDESWANFADADLAGIPWLMSMFAGFVDVETTPLHIKAAREHHNAVRHEAVEQDDYRVANPCDFLADVVAAIEYVQDALEEFAEKYKTHKPADDSADKDARRWAARFRDDFNGGAWVIGAALCCLLSEQSDEERTAAVQRLEARLSRSPWLVAAEGGGR